MSGSKEVKTEHRTQKPVECMKRPIENNSSPGQAVYEPFAGSFTTGIAAEMTGRSIHAIEIAPQYVDVGCQRWANFTGKTPILEATGQTFAQVSASRLPNDTISPSDGSATAGTKTASSLKPKAGRSPPTSDQRTAVGQS